MLLWRRPSLLGCLLLVAIFWGAVASQDLSKFDICKIRVDRIMSGTETFGAINNETILPLLYTGPVQGMKVEFERTSRNSFITITTEGCKILCEDPIDWYWSTDISLTLNIISNWILPIIALIAALPWDSHHRKNAGASWYKSRFWRTIGALLNWLGSPQTALTATFFNIHQIRKCLHETLPSGEGTSGNRVLEPLKQDAYYVLSCIGQYKLEKLDERFLKTLIYGLFNPISNVVKDEEGHTGGDERRRRDQEATTWTRELLQVMAFQLRMLRRRGVYPTFISILLFFIAYAVSLVLAFADIGERTTAHSLAFGILISWFPLLVLFALVDRNPVSSDRTKKLISRWMWNVEAVREWVNDQNSSGHPNWWSQSKETAGNQLGGEHASFDGYISDFVGQGRQVGYNGLPYAVLVSVYDKPWEQRKMQSLDTVFNQLDKRFKGRRPGSWWVLSIVSLALVWWEIGMAFMISYNIPTVGIGCRSASYLIYGVLSSITWMFHLLPCFGKPGTKMKALCHFFSLLSTLTLFFIIFAAFSGILKNCFCRGGHRGYLDFEDAQFYRNKDHFDVAKWWWAGAILGALPMFGSFLAAWFLLQKLKPLWQVSEQSNPLWQASGQSNPQWGDTEIEMQWLI